MKLEATHNRVIIRPDAEHVSSRLIIPESVKRFSDRGTVIAVGPGRRHMDGVIYPQAFKPGDRVLFSKMHVFPIELDGEKLMVMEGEEILAVMAVDPMPEPMGSAAN